MLNLKPVIRINGDIRMTGDAVTMGSEQSLSIQFSQPAENLNETVRKRVVAGTYYAVGLDLQGTNERVVGKRTKALTSNALSESAGTLGKDEFIGEYLYIRALTYFFANDKIYTSGAKLYNTAVTRTISEGITSFPLNVSQVFGIAKAVSPSGVELDVAMDRIIAVSKNGDTVKEKTFMDIAGLVSSYHEHSIFENIDGIASVSAVRALQVASANGIQIQHINISNVGQLLPALQVAAEIKTDIQNAINSGKEVTIPQTNITINDWTGVGYIVKDLNTGSGAYMISGGLGGMNSTSEQAAQQATQAFVSVLNWVIDMLSYALGGTIAECAELSIGDRIVQSVQPPSPLVNMPYPPDGDPPDEDEADCSKLVHLAYSAAGVDIDQLVSIKNLKLSGNGANQLFQAVSSPKLSPYGGIKKNIDANNIPNKGDMVFFDYGAGVAHVGIVVSEPGEVPIHFVHTTLTLGVHDSNWNSDLGGKKHNHLRAYQCFVGFGTVRDLK